MATIGTLPANLQNFTSGGMSVAPTQSTPKPYSGVPFVQPVTTPAITQSTTIKAPTGSTTANKLPQKPVGTANATLGANIGGTAPTPPTYDIMSGQLTAYGKSIGAKDVNGAPQAPTTPTTPTAPAPLTGNDLVLQRLDKAYTQLGGMAQATTAENTAQGVDVKTQQLNDLNNQALTKKREYENQIRALQTNVEGRYGTGTNVAVQNLQRQGNQELADIAIQQQVAQGNLDTAVSLVKQKIDAQYEPIQLQIQSLRDYASINANDLTESEKIKVTAEANKLQKQIDVISDAKKDAYKIALDGGANQATLDKIGKATTVEGAYGAVGVYGVSAEKRASIAKINREAEAVGLPSITSSGASDYSSAISLVLGSSKFSREQKADFIKGVNTGQDPFQLIKNQAKNIMGQTLATDLDKAETAKAQLVNIDKSLKDYYANGGKTGIFSGNFEKTLNKLGEVKDANLVGVATEIALAMQAYRLAVTGTAASVQEDARIDNVFPGITNGEVLNDARTKATIKSFETKIDSQYRNTLGSAYDTLKQDQKDVTSKAPETMPANIISAVQTAVKNGYTPISIIQRIQSEPTIAKYIATAKANKYSDQEIVDYIKNFK